MGIDSVHLNMQSLRMPEIFTEIDKSFVDTEVFQCNKKDLKCHYLFSAHSYLKIFLEIVSVYVFLNVVNKCHTWNAEKAIGISHSVHEYLLRFFSIIHLWLSRRVL